MDAHRGAFEYDWRTRFRLPLTTVGRSMGFGEAVRLTHALASDPTSQVCAALAGWDYPVTHESIVLMNLYDLEHQIAWAQAGGKGHRPTPHVRPWPDRDETKKSAPAPEVTQDQIVAALRAAGHDHPLPREGR